MGIQIIAEIDFEGPRTITLDLVETSSGATIDYVLTPAISESDFPAWQKRLTAMLRDQERMSLVGGFKNVGNNTEGQLEWQSWPGRSPRLDLRALSLPT